jgi:hypothetical protein
MRKTPIFVLSALAALAVIAAAGCYVEPSSPAPVYGGQPAYVEGSVSVGAPVYEYPTADPPEPIYETVPAAPAYGYVWIDGYWNWSGARWVWWRGHWEEPRAGYVYVQPYYSYQSGRRVYVPAHWNQPTALPQGVIVRDHTDGRPPTAVWTGNTYHYRTAPMPAYAPRPTTVVPAAPAQRPTTVVPAAPAPQRPTTVVPPAAPPPRPTTVVPPAEPPPRPTTVVPPAPPQARGNPHGAPPGQVKQADKDVKKVKEREHRKDD